MMSLQEAERWCKADVHHAIITTIQGSVHYLICWYTTQSGEVEATVVDEIGEDQ